MRKHKLLVIDDELEILDSIRDVLLGNFDVETANDGLSGLRLAKELQPDAILLDLLMPRMNGIEVCQQLRANPSTQRIPIIMMTAARDDDRRSEALLAGVDDLISKPFGPKEVMVRLQSRLDPAGRRPSGESSDVKKEGVIRCGNLTLDPNTYRVTINGRYKELTLLEMSLLRFLLKNRDLILSRERILDAVWGDREVSGRVVDNHILALRRKLHGFDHDIVSVYGAGYGIQTRG